jgi:hypothetical protein
MMRGEEDSWGVIVTQALDIGQFVLDSAYLSPSYWKFIEEEEDDEEEDEYED